VELMVILPLPLEQCRAVVESLALPYPLYACSHGSTLFVGSG
jgi:hypothetical protein